MSIDGAVFFARRWPRAGIAALTCALLVALGLISCPAATAARAAHGPLQPHRPVGKVCLTNDAPGAASPLWNHAPDQDVAVADPHVFGGHGAVTDSVHRDVAGRPLPSVHSRGPPD